MTVREACRSDCSEMDGMLTELIRYEVRYDGNLNPDCVVENNYDERLGLPGHKAFIAEADGETAGFVYGFVYSIPGMYLRPIAVLDALYVKEAYRGKGVGKELFLRFKDFAAGQGALRIELKVMSENGNALRFYENLGFRETKKYMALGLE